MIPWKTKPRLARYHKNQQQKQACFSNLHSIKRTVKVTRVTYCNIAIFSNSVSKSMPIRLKNWNHTQERCQIQRGKPWFFTAPYLHKFFFSRYLYLLSTPYRKRFVWNHHLGIFFFCPSYRIATPSKREYQRWRYRTITLNEKLQVGWHGH